MGAMITAIVSAYYAEKYLEGRIVNLLEQSLRPEIVVVCHEGSPEYRIAEKYLFEKPQILIRWLDASLPIPTVYEAWNLAIGQATGEYLTNANCDDRLHPGALEASVRALDEHPDFAAAYFDIDQVKEIGGVPVGRFEWAEGGLAQLLQGCFLGPMPVWRRSLHDKYGYFDPSFHSAGDYEFWMRLAAGGEKFFHIRQILGSYLVRPDSAEHREPMRATWETARARARYREVVRGQ